jgi:hypothetical protein
MGVSGSTGRGSAGKEAPVGGEGGRGWEGSMADTWQSIVASEESGGGGEGEEELGGGQERLGRRREQEVLTSDDEGEPVHVAACLLEEEAEDDVSPPSKPGWDTPVFLLSPSLSPPFLSRARVRACHLTPTACIPMKISIQPSPPSTYTPPPHSVGTLATGPPPARTSAAGAPHAGGDLDHFCGELVSCRPREQGSWGRGSGQGSQCSRVGWHWRRRCGAGGGERDSRGGEPGRGCLARLASIKRHRRARRGARRSVMAVCRWLVRGVRL